MPAIAPSLSFAETGTLPWLTRKHGPFEVAITIRAKRLPVGVFPLNAADHALDVIGRAFPGVIEPCGDALSGALMNAGPIIHPPLIVMNAGPIEHFERWDIHKEGTQSSIRRVTDALDAERIAVREASRLWRARIFRWRIITPPRARYGCMAAARTTG